MTTTWHERASSLTRSPGEEKLRVEQTLPLVDRPCFPRSLRWLCARRPDGSRSHGAPPDRGNQRWAGAAQLHSSFTHPGSELKATLGDVCRCPWLSRRAARSCFSRWRWCMCRTINASPYVYGVGMTWNQLVIINLTRGSFPGLWCALSWCLVCTTNSIQFESKYWLLASHFRSNMNRFHGGWWTLC
jgi:hypothetical protein